MELSTPVFIPKASLHLPLMMMYLNQYLITLTIYSHWFAQESFFIWQLMGLLREPK
ncbi:hypothetical protein CsSME_00011118 [Camellia sinensis var. sinensis]